MIKLFIPIIFIIVFTISQSCRKDDQVCYDYIELKDTNHLTDISFLKTVPEMLDTLDKYPQLKVASILNDEYQTAMFCNYFYKGLICFNASYSLHKDKRDNDLFCSDFTPKKIDVNISPNLPFTKAIEIAKQKLDFRYDCIAYRLGLSYEDTSAIETSTSYKLVWKIQDTYGSRYIIMDANDGQVYHIERGIWE